MPTSLHQLRSNCSLRFRRRNRETPGRATSDGANDDGKLYSNSITLT